MMDRFLAPHTPEAVAHDHVSENMFEWDMDHVDPEPTIALCASYRALSRFLSGADLIFPPRNRRELEGILVRYSHDAIHNMIAKSRTTLQAGGYSRICHFAEESIRNMLSQNDNTTTLLALHKGADVVKEHTTHDPSHPTRIKI